MFFFKTKHLWLVVVLSVIIAPFVLFSSSLRPWQTSSKLSLVWQEVLFPLEYGWHKVYTFSCEMLHHYVTLSDSAKENTHLKNELALLQSKLMDYEHKEQEANRLRQLLGFTQTYQREVIAAEVVGFVSSPFQSLRLARGSSDKVQVGMPVVNESGVVGRILRVGFQFADVLLLTDANFNLDVLVERTRVRGVLRGIGENQCRLQLHHRSDIRIGDTIVTSGIVGGFPKGLPVGQVKRISFESDDVSQVVTIKPWVESRRLEEVLVLKNLSPEVEKIIDTATNDWIEATPFNVGGKY